MAPLDIVIITNSPGELSSWVRATVKTLRRRSTDARLVVMLVPCPFASGGEARIARSFEEVDVVVPPSRFFQFALGFNPPGYRPAPHGVVVFLGGDFWHALLVAARLRYPAIAYGASGYRWGRYFSRTCVQDDRAQERMLGWGIPRERVEVVGNLISEAAQPSMPRSETQARWGLDPDKATIGILPGSRQYHAQVSLPVFLKVAEEIHQQRPDTQFVVGQSPFLTDEALLACLSPLRGGIAGVSAQRVGDDLLETAGGLRVRLVKGRQYDLMNVSDLMLCIPGTNTAEGASFGRPMLVCMTWKAPIPRGGLGFVTNVLPMYSTVRKRLLESVRKKLRYTALPNILAGHMIVPEICVEESSTEISDVAVRLLGEPETLARMAAELTELLGKKGAAERMADAILRAAEQTSTNHERPKQPSSVEAGARVGL
ncbi:MAG TPA: hypothetical protein VGO93_31115 [Candidatus Xenobia bacterium]